MELSAAEKDDHAISQFEQARKLSPGMKGISHSLAVLYDRQGMLDAAEREYNKAIAELPKSADVHNDFGYFLYSRGQYEDAKDKLQRALSLQPDHPRAEIIMAMVLGTQKEFDEAFIHFENALGPAVANHNIGFLKLRAGLKSEAIAHFEKSSTIDPSVYSKKLLAALSSSSDNTA